MIFQEISLLMASLFSQQANTGIKVKLVIYLEAYETQVLSESIMFPARYAIHTNTYL